MAQKVLFTWSGGKDSAIALYELKRDRDYEISALLTTVTEDYGRISMHGVRTVLLEQQAASLGLPLEKIYITKNASNNEYEEKMKAKLEYHQSQGVAAVAFGDISLEELRRYREENLSRIGIKAVFPIWGRDTLEIAHAFINLGFKAIITCIDSNVLNKKFAGRIFDRKFLCELPSGIDPCGENGEFHSFVHDGPIFREEILFTIGDILLRNNRFYFCDLIPA